MSLVRRDDSKVGLPSRKGKKGKSRCKSGLTRKTQIAKQSPTLVLALKYTGEYGNNRSRKQERNMVEMGCKLAVIDETEGIAYFRYSLKNDNQRMDIINRLQDKCRDKSLTVEIFHQSTSEYGGIVHFNGKKTGSTKPGSIVRELFRQTEASHKWQRLLVSMYGTHEYVCPKNSSMSAWYLATYKSPLPASWKNEVIDRDRIAREYLDYTSEITTHIRHCQLSFFAANESASKAYAIGDEIGHTLYLSIADEWDRRKKLIIAWKQIEERKEEITKTRTLLRETAKSLFARMDILKKRKHADNDDMVYSRKVYAIVRNYLDMPKKELFSQSDYVQQMNTIATLTSDVIRHSWNCPISAKELSEHTPTDAVFASKHFDDTHIIHGLSNEDNIGKSINPIGYNKSMPEWEAKQTIVAIGYNRVCPFPVMNSYAMGI